MRGAQASIPGKQRSSGGRWSSVVWQQRRRSTEQKLALVEKAMSPSSSKASPTDRHEVRRSWMRSSLRCLEAGGIAGRRAGLFRQLTAPEGRSILRSITDRSGHYRPVGTGLREVARKPVEIGLDAGQPRRFSSDQAVKISELIADRCLH